MELKHILVPIDFSDTAGKALDLAKKVAAATGAPIELLHVSPPLTSYESYSGYVLPDGLGELNLSNARENLRELAESLGREGVKASSEIIADGTGVAEAICERAGQPEQGLIVMGTHGRSGIQLGVLGSVSEKVAVAAPVPVIHVRGSRRPNSGTFKKILIAHDFSDPSREAVRIGGAYARQLGADVTLMHVFEIVEPAFLEMSLPDVDRFAICDAANSAMASDMEALKREGTSVSRHTTIGRPAQQIVAHAIANDFDLIVVGTQGRTGFRRFVMGSVARRVICTSEIPVMSCRQV